MEVLWTGAVNIRHVLFPSAKVDLKQVVTFRPIGLFPGRNGPPSNMFTKCSRGHRSWPWTSKATTKVWPLPASFIFFTQDTVWPPLLVSPRTGAPGCTAHPLPPGILRLRHLGDRLRPQKTITKTHEKSITIATQNVGGIKLE